MRKINLTPLCIKRAVHYRIDFTVNDILILGRALALGFRFLNANGKPVVAN
jgi:hypothetical protein